MRRPLHLRIVADRVRGSLWLVPTLMVLGAIGLSTGLLYLDAHAHVGSMWSQWWLFAGNADGARALLSAVAGSLITVVSVAFSVTIIAIQQASTQYTPRVLRNYTKDRGNQIVLGTYVATFTYALLVLRSVRGSSDGASSFVPTFSVLGAVVLALASLGALIYFMHHVTDSLQVSTLLSSIRAEIDAEIERMFPDTFGRGGEDPRAFADEIDARERGRGDRAHAVTGDAEGYLRRIDERALERACAGLELVAIPVQIGERLQRDTVVARTWPPRRSDELDEAIRGAFELDRQRSTEQDVLFGFRQIVDIAVKALSPGINDPTTAEQATAELVGAVAKLLAREMPDPIRRGEGGTVFVFAVPTFEQIVEQSFSQIRRAARDHPHVTHALVAGLRVLADRAEGPRSAPIRRQLDQILEALPRAPLTVAEERALRDAVREASRRAQAPRSAEDAQDALH